MRGILILIATRLSVLGLAAVAALGLMATSSHADVTTIAWVLEPGSVVSSLPGEIGCGQGVRLVDGTLPLGLSGEFDEQSGCAVVTGTVDRGTQGLYSFAVAVATPTGPEVVANVSLTVVAPVEIATTNIALDVIAGRALRSFVLQSVPLSGQAPPTWTVSAGRLPTGLALSTSGVLRGRVRADVRPKTYRIEVSASPLPESSLVPNGVAALGPFVELGAGPVAASTTVEITVR